MSDPGDIVPPTEAGSDTFARYRYQAEITLPYCLECALGDDIVSVVPEHVEDIALECENSWRFIQVKSRNPERGLWRLSHLCKRGGALRSLYRTYLLTRRYDCSLELVLEGAVDPDNPIRQLKRDGNHRDSELVEYTKQRLGVATREEAEEFLGRVLLLAQPSTRKDIRARNYYLIQNQDRSLSGETVSRIHNELIELIESAMRAERAGMFWPAYMTDPSGRSDTLKRRIDAKRLGTRELQRAVQPLGTPPKPLLGRIVDESTQIITPLEIKLLVAGATPNIVERARHLRANANYEKLELASQSLSYDSQKWYDFRERIKVRAESKEALYSWRDRPANHIWDELLETFTSAADVIDRHELLSKDPLLLMGELCDISNSCGFRWGVPDEA